MRAAALPPPLDRPAFLLHDVAAIGRAARKKAKIVVSSPHRQAGRLGIGKSQ